LQLLLATHNEGKLLELRNVLADLEIELVGLAALPPVPEVDEDRSTFEGNARKKADHYFQHAQLATLAEDSGLEIEALEGAPGVRSARYADTDQQRIKKVLHQLRNVSRGWSRRARFVCAVCLVGCDGTVMEVEGEVWGEILESPRGRAGFGYDPIFYYPPLGMTFAEMALEQKNRISHRSVALHKLKQQILRRKDWQTLFGSP
jgi:XTP/dITP diphosphohydrolase